jgi:cyclopropane-fatty-acyl-phospholipid synthase
MRADTHSPSTVTAPRDHGTHPWLERTALATAARALGSPPVRFELWTGVAAFVPVGPAVATIRFRDRPSLWRFLAAPAQGFLEGYERGGIEVEGDLVAVAEYGLRATRTSTPSPAWWPAVRRNTAARARRNARSHYDLGNEFYAQWLDERLVYTCAYFARPDLSLEAAQLAKLEYVCRKLELRPGQRLVEAGCGWGALAMHAAQHHGVVVRAYNVSRAQLAYARRRAFELGLADRVDFVEGDYRGIQGTYDAFVSVGMLEHVGPKHYPALRRVIDRCLTDEGRGLLHFIGRARPRAIEPWLEREIFPGAYFPSLREMLEVLEPADFAVLDVENLRPHYVRTLELWLERFERARPRIAEMFDERFVRRWRLYLAGARAAFGVGACQLYQVAFARSDAEIAWTRAGCWH